MRLLLSFVRRQSKLLAAAVGLATVNQFFSLLDPQIFRLIVDRYATKALTLPPGVFLRGVGVLLAASVGVALVSRVAKNFQDYFVSAITQRVGTRLYAHGLQHALRLPYAVFEDQRSGELLLKLQKARLDAQNIITSAINVVFLSLVGILFVVGYAFTVHWLIGLLYLAMIPSMGLLTFAISRQIKQAQARIVREAADLAGSTTETLRNVELVKSLGLETQEIGRLNDVNDNLLALELKKIRLIRALSFIQGTMINAMRSLLLLVMLWLIFRQAISLGEFFSLFVYSFFIFSPLYELGTVAAQFQEARASLAQVEEILQTPREATPLQPRPVGNLQTVQFDRVTFRYAGGDTPSVADISLTLRGGQTVALVGPSGSGKSTLVKLLVGLYQPSSGNLAFNGVPVSGVDLPALRQRIGLVLQETQLFAGTIRDNLLFVRPDASDADCQRVLELANVSEILTRGGQGLNTKIGEGGIKISGGERQRLAIARALLRDPELIIFDEATSSLDSITEKAITQTIQGLERAHPNVMTVLVAHRLSTVQHARVIYVLERGRIVERGNHAELVSAGGLYAALWREQSASQR